MMKWGYGVTIDWARCCLLSSFFLWPWSTTRFSSSPFPLLLLPPFFFAAFLSFFDSFLTSRVQMYLKRFCRSLFCSFVYLSFLYSVFFPPYVKPRPCHLPVLDFACLFHFRIYHLAASVRVFWYSHLVAGALTYSWSSPRERQTHIKTSVCAKNNTNERSK